MTIYRRFPLHVRIGWDRVTASNTRGVKKLMGFTTREVRGVSLWNFYLLW